MKPLKTLTATFALSSLIVGSSFAANVTLTGAGSTFIYPVLSKWATRYHHETGNKVNYQAIGSGGGLRQLQEKTVDFAASDKPLTAKQLKANDYLQFPAIVGGIVLGYNLPAVHQTLALNGQTLADIYQGKIKYWDNSAIKKLNPQVKLPHTYITVVHRSDGSGTTYNFTYYLSQVSQEWAKQVGYNTVVAWPGVSVGGKGNAGVAGYIKQIPGAIGYVEYAYAKETHIPVLSLKNRAGHVVKPDMASFEAAAQNADWSAKDGFHLILANSKGAKSWPIAASTFVLVRKQEKAAKIAEVLKFFDWSYQHGRQDAFALDYVPMPKSVTQKVAQVWQQQKYKA